MSDGRISIVVEKVIRTSQQWRKGTLLGSAMISRIFDVGLDKFKVVRMEILAVELRCGAIYPKMTYGHI